MIDENGVHREDCLVHLRDDVQYTSDDGIFMKGMIMNRAGTIVGQHAHAYGHTSILTQGRVRLEAHMLGVDYKQEYTAPAFIKIPPKVKHKFIALEDNTHVYCIHNMTEYHLITDGNPLIHEKHTINGGA